MELDQGPDPFNAAQKISRTIWLALCFAVVGWGGLVWFLSLEWGPESKDVLPAMQWATIAVAIGAGSASVWFQRIQYGPRKLAQLAEGNETKAAGIFLTGHLIGWFLAELVAFCGFFLAMLGQQMTYYLPFAVASLVLFAVERPDTGPYERTISEGSQPLTPPNGQPPTTSCASCGSQASVEGTVVRLGRWIPREIRGFVLTLSGPGIPCDTKVRVCSSCRLTWTWLNTTEANRTLEIWASKGLRARLKLWNSRSPGGASPQPMPRARMTRAFVLVSVIALATLLIVAIVPGENRLAAQLLLGILVALVVLPVLLLVARDVARGEYEIEPAQPCPHCGGARCIWGRFSVHDEREGWHFKSWANIWEPVPGSASPLRRGKIVVPQLACLDCGFLFTTLR